MGPDGVGEGVAVVDPDLHLAGRHHAEQGGGAVRQFGARGVVRHQRRTGEVERPLGGEQAGIERRNGAGRLAERRQQAARREAVERPREGRLPHRVVRHRNALAAGDLPHPFDEILARIDDGVVAAVGAGELRLLVGADGADDRRADGLRPLAGDEADAAGGGVEEDGLARLHRVGAAQEILRRHALEHHRGGGLVVDALRDLDDVRGGHQADLGVGAHGRGRVGDAVADRRILHPGADRLHRARALEARRERALDGIQPRTVVGVDVVQADETVADADLAGAGVADLDLLPAHDFGAARLMGADGVAFHGFRPLLRLGRGFAGRRARIRARAENVSRPARRSSRRACRRRP